MSDNVDKFRRHPEICRPRRTVDRIQRDRAFKGKGFLAAQAGETNGLAMTDRRYGGRMYRLHQIGLRQDVEDAVNAGGSRIGG